MHDMGAKSIVNESKQIRLAIEMIHLGARLQMIEAETTLSRERLLRLYKEIRGVSPPKGMLPYSTDWFMTWHSNTHSSLYMGIYQFIVRETGAAGVRAILDAYQLYLEHLEARGLERVLSLTRVWRLVKFFEARMLQTAPCTRCGGRFVVHTDDLYEKFVCGLCNVPSRAGRGHKRKIVSGLAQAA
jgi:flagellar transcriptional activator FlhC